MYFLAIHPFQDGNGRLSRALTNLLLLRCGYAYVPYVSLESIVEVSKDGYYLALRNTQKSFLEEKKDYSAWLNFFLTMLHKQKTILEQKINSVEQKEELSAKAIAVLELFDKHEELTSSIISQEMNFNLETVRKILQQLTERKIIKRYGTTKSRRYRKMNGYSNL